MGTAESTTNRVDPYESLATGLEAHTARHPTSTQEIAGHEFSVCLAMSKASSRFKKLLAPCGHKGPDQLAQAEAEVTWQIDMPVKLCMAMEGPMASRPVSVPTLLKTTVQAYPDHVAMAVKRDGQWVKWTYHQYYNDVRLVAKAFLKLGLVPYHGVGILGFNAPEWYISNMAAIFAGGVSVGIYTTNSPEGVHYVAHNSCCSILVVENDLQAQKVIKVRDDLPDLKAIVQYSGEVQDSLAGILTWAEVQELGKTIEDSALEERLAAQAPNKCCSLIYTSGTTGNPKAVMLSHDNITWSQLHTATEMHIRPGQETVVSYLPLSHVAAQALDIYGIIVVAGTIYFAQPDALRGSLIHTLREVKPTIFMGVPRVYEKFQEAMLKAGKNSKSLKKALVCWATKIGRKGTLSSMEGKTGTPFGWTLAKCLVFSKVKKALGLSRCRLLITGAAPLSTDTVNFFMGFNIPVTEMYGMSECSGAHTAAFPWHHRVGSVGSCIAGRESKFCQEDKEGVGELCMRGRHVFMGYLGQEEETQKALDKSGWLHTGDLGREDSHGFIYLTGRSKELLITAGGENVAPVPIENLVKEQLPVTMVDEDTLLPSDELAEDTLQWCHQLGSEAITISELLKGREKNIQDAIQHGIDSVNSRAISRAQKIQKWAILSRDFSIPGGKLGPTLKLKRKVVLERQAELIKDFYANK